MLTFTETPADVLHKLQTRSTRDLLRDFMLTEHMRDRHIPTVRGWILDELERRNPEAMEAWLSQEAPLDRQLRTFYSFQALELPSGFWAVWHQNRGNLKMECLNAALISRQEAIAEILRLATA